MIPNEADLILNQCSLYTFLIIKKKKWSSSSVYRIYRIRTDGVVHSYSIAENELVSKYTVISKCDINDHV